MFQGIFGLSPRSTQVRSARKTSVERDKHLTRSNPEDTYASTQLNALETYLDKLDQNDKQKGSDIVESGETKLTEEHGFADNYLGKLVSGNFLWLRLNFDTFKARILKPPVDLLTEVRKYNVVSQRRG